MVRSLLLALLCALSLSACVQRRYAPELLALDLRDVRHPVMLSCVPNAPAGRKVAAKAVLAHRDAATPMYGGSTFATFGGASPRSAIGARYASRKGLDGQLESQAKPTDRWVRIESVTFTAYDSGGPNGSYSARTVAVEGEACE